MVAKEVQLTNRAVAGRRVGLGLNRRGLSARSAQDSTVCDCHRTLAYADERGPAVSAEAKKVRARKMIRELRSLGYLVELISPAPTA